MARRSLEDRLLSVDLKQHKRYDLPDAECPLVIHLRIHSKRKDFAAKTDNAGIHPGRRSEAAQDVSCIPCSTQPTIRAIVDGNGNNLKRLYCPNCGHTDDLFSDLAFQKDPKADTTTQFNG